MIIPTSFTQAIGTNFYDKEVDVYTTSDVQDEEGQAYKEATEIAGSVMGNVNFNNLDLIQEQYGLQEKVDIAITTRDAIGGNANIIGYGGYQYLVIKAVSFDSHILMLGKLWLSKSSTLPSA